MIRDNWQASETLSGVTQDPVSFITKLNHPF